MKTVNISGSDPIREENNPTLSREQLADERAEVKQRVSMSAPSLKMQVDCPDGYVCYWFNDYPGRVQRAIQAGYEFVDPEEVNVALTCYADDPAISGNTDLGSRVSLVVGEYQGHPLRAYYMKIREEWYKEDQEALDARCQSMDRQIYKGLVGHEEDQSQDRDKRYSKDVDVRTGFGKRKPIG